MLKKIGIGLFVIIALFLGYVALLPSEMFITRELLIKADPAAIFPYLNNNQKADEWMPWREVDPSVKMIYSGPVEGVGSTSTWDSSGQMGTGQAVVVESVLNQVVKTQLNYTKPFQMSQLAEVGLVSSDGGTKVRWVVIGQNNFICKLMGVFMNMDKMVGGEFEKGLLKLKSIVEKRP